jgi:hypothetical protein
MVLYGSHSNKQTVTKQNHQWALKAPSRATNTAVYSNRLRNTVSAAAGVPVPAELTFTMAGTFVQLAVILAAFTACGGAKFYIYDTGGWPNISTASLYKRDPNERLENSLHGGAGPLVEKIAGEYHTDQYMLFSMIYNRALKDPRRTLNPADATSFLVPYDFASDCAFYKNCAKSSGVCYDFRKCPLAPEVESLLAASPWFQRKGGRDHTLVIGMNYAMDHYILKPKCKSLISGICSNCTKFAIDDYSFMYADDEGVRVRGDYWHAIPFPSDFHWTQHVKRPFPWENTDRPILVSYIGSTRSYYGPARRLRQSIVHYCELHTADCVHNSYGLNGTRFSFKVEGHRPLQLSQKSVFCFQPIGDLMTRKGLFDSILQGCIPVVFEALTARVMYTWHWEESFWHDVIVEYTMHPVAHRYFDPVVALKKLLTENPAEVARKQELIRQRVFQLQYGLDGLEELFQYDSPLEYIALTQPRVVPANASDAGEAVATSKWNNDAVVYTKRTGKGSEHVSHKGASSTWPKDARGNYLRDAYDIVMDLALEWHSSGLRGVRNATVTECWNGWLDKAANQCKPGKEPGKARRLFEAGG